MNNDCGNWLALISKCWAFRPDAVVADYLERCRGFIFSAEEDFGITVVEAQAAGAPVIAYGRGGAVETVVPDQTGLLFYPQTVLALAAAVTQFEQQRSRFDPWVIRANAERFGD
jgi:glycosyltransferase involved in cell wall biosynthesis